MEKYTDVVDRILVLIQTGEEAIQYIVNSQYIEEGELSRLLSDLNLLINQVDTSISDFESSLKKNDIKTISEMCLNRINKLLSLKESLNNESRNENFLALGNEFSNLSKEIYKSLKQYASIKRLNLGCGKNILEDFINIDVVSGEGVDIVFDLDNCKHSKLPFEENTVSEFYGSHLIEHLQNPLPLMDELYRIAKPNAVALFRVPYGSSDDAFEDPTHVRQYFKNSFSYFSQPFYWRADYGYSGDWLTEQITFLVDEKIHKGKSNKQIMYEIDTHRNIVLEMLVELKAIKPAREPLKELQSRPNYNISFVK